MFTLDKFLVRLKIFSVRCDLNEELYKILDILNGAILF